MFDVPMLPRKLDAALRDVSDERQRVRASALCDLVAPARDGEARAVAALVAALDDSAPEVREAACLAVADAGLREAEPGLRRALDDSDSRVPPVALLALGEVGARGAGPSLDAVAARLGATEPRLRFYALRALVSLASEVPLAALTRALGDADAEVRYLAALLVEEARVTTLDSALAGALRDPVPRVRLAAALALGSRGGAAAEAALVGALAARRGELPEDDVAAAIERAGALGLGAAEPSLERLAFPRLRREPLATVAVAALARLGHPRARAVILGDLRSRRAERRRAAVVAAGAARLKEARPLIVALRGEVDAAVVDEALGRLDEQA